MSWLSSLFDSGPDPQVLIAQGLAQQRAAQAEAQARADAAAQQQQMFEMEQQRQAREDAAREADRTSSAATNQSYIDYLNTLRTDQVAKEAELKAKDPTETRAAALRSVNQTFAPGFETGYLPSTYDDPLAGTVYQEQYNKADEFLNNLFKRGVITNTGRAAATKSLEEQAPRVRTQLQGIGDALLQSRRDALSGIAGRAREATTGLGVGDAFDINPYSAQVQSSINDFSSQFPDLFRSQISGPLFDTSGLGAIAGGAQGAGVVGTPETPTAIPGEKADETDPFSGQKPVQKRTTSVF